MMKALKITLHYYDYTFKEKVLLIAVEIHTTQNNNLKLHTNKVFN